MTPQLFFALLGATLVGVFALVVGRRGRKVNKHPICRSCGFDLHGVFPPAITCPECGSGLKRDIAIRYGARRPVRTLQVLGLVLVLIPVVPLGFVLFSAMTGSDINKYKPLPLLLWEAPRASARSCDAIADEILDRVLRGQLTSDEASRAIDLALELQADQKHSWSEAWGALVDRAHLDGVMDSGRMQRFYSNAAVLKLEARQAVPIDGLVPTVITLSEARVGASHTLRANLTVDSVALDGVKFDVYGASNRGASTISKFVGAISSRSYQGWLEVSGSKSQSRFFAETSVNWTFQLPAGTPVGPHVLEVVVRREMGGLSGRTTQKLAEVPPTTLTAPFRIVPQDTEIVALIEPNESTETALRAALLPRRVSVDERGGSYHRVQVQLSMKDLPVPVAFFVSARSGEKTWNIGVCTSGKGWEGIPPFLDWGSEKLLSALHEDFVATEVDLVFTPSVELASRTVDLTKIFGREIVVNNLRVSENK